MPEETTPKNPFDRFTIDNNTCFLCGESLDGTRTKEHVFPQWLLADYSLRHAKLTLLNGTPIKYNQLTIPCCSECNNNCLSSLEKKIKESVHSGYKAVSQLPKIEIFQWLGKIFYGLLRKELTLPHDRASDSYENIIPASLLERFSCLHAFLQSVHKPFEFPSEEPFSVLVANLHTPHQDDLFFFRDSLEHMTCAIRMGSVGIIIALDDGGLLRETYQHYLDEVDGHPLTPLQFDELYAKCLYQVSLLRTPTTFAIHTVTNGPVIVNMIGRGYVDEWVMKDYVPILEQVLSESYPQLDTSVLYSSPGLVMTWMYDQAGQLTLVNEEGKQIYLNNTPQ